MPSLVVRMASAQSDQMPPIPMFVLLRSAYKKVQDFFPLAEESDKRIRAWREVLGALERALHNHSQILNRRDLYCETGPPVVEGGERTKLRIEPGSQEHRKRVAEPFEKILDKKKLGYLARHIVDHDWEPAIS